MAPEQFNKEQVTLQEPGPLTLAPSLKVERWASSVERFENQGPRGRQSCQPRRFPRTCAAVGRPVWTLLLVLLGLLAPPVRAAEQYAEYDVKAAWLYVLMDYTKWPSNAFADPKGPFLVGILGSDPWKGKLGESYQAAGAKTMKGRGLVVTNCASATEARKCHLVFISKSERNRLEQILEELKGTNVLTVVEAERPVETEGVLSLYMKGKVQYMINEAAAERAGLLMGSVLKEEAAKLFRKGS